MQSDKNFIVNIVSLQNVQSNVSGLDNISELTKDIASIKRLVHTDTNRIFTNSLGSYTTGGSISVTSPVNFLCNVGVTSNLNSLGTGRLSNLSSVLSVYPSNDSRSTVLTMATASFPSTMTVTQGGDLTMAGSGTFEICYARQFVTLSDMMAKQNIREWRSSVSSDLQKIRPYIFKYEGSTTEDIGLLSQEVGSIWPQLIKEGVRGSYVNYDGMVALLLKSVQELGARVSTLEGRFFS